MKIEKCDVFRDSYVFVDSLIINKDTTFNDFEKFVKTSLELYLEYKNAEYGVYITEKLWEYAEDTSNLVYIFECMQNNDLHALDKMFLED